jgi:predicted Zn-dependent protease with MMP-like domain
MRRRRLSWDEFCDIVREAVISLPPQFQPYLQNVVVDVEEEPSDRDLATVDDDAEPSSDGGNGDHPDDHLLFGIFRGVPITKQGYGDHYPNQIVIFRRAHEAASRTRTDLLRNIRATVVHELAHHFGFSEADLESFERAQERYLDLGG